MKDIGKHVRVLGGLYLGYGIFLLAVAGLTFFILILTSPYSDDPQAPIAPLIGIFVGVILTINAVPCLFAGYGLLDGKGWAHILTLVMGVFSLTNIPLGTALGVYTFIVLLRPEARAYLESMNG